LLKKDNNNLIYKDLNKLKLYCDNRGPCPRPFIPQTLRKVIFNDWHNMSHPGVRHSKFLISNKYFWPGLRSDIALWCRECEICQKSKIIKHIKPDPGHMPVCSARF
jgi:hypothetical protein